MSFFAMRTILLTLLVLLVPAAAGAQFTIWNFICDSGHRMTWQAAVTDSSGTPIAPGTYSLEYCYYADSLKTALIGCCTTSAVVTPALFAGAKDAATTSMSVAKAYLAYPDPYEDTAKKSGAADVYISGLWLEITFNGELMEPVTPIGSMPFSGVSRRVTGDLVTRPGDLFLPGRGGSGGGFNASADSGGTRVVLERSPAASSPASDTSWLEFTLDADGSRLTMGNAVALGADTTYVVLGADAGGGRVVVQDSLGVARTSVLGSGLFIYNAGNGATSYFTRSGIRIPQGAAAGYVLTSSASGVGTWQAPNGAIGVAQALEGTLGTSIDTVLTVMLSRTITCPMAGYVLAIGSCQGRINHIFPYENSVDFGLSLSSTSLPLDQDKNWRLADSVAGGLYDASISVQRIFPVTAGDTTIYFLARDNQFGAGTPQAWDKTLSLLFVPNAFGIVAGSPAKSDGNDVESAVVRSGARQPSDSPDLSAEQLSLEERVRLLETQLKQLQSEGRR